MKNHFRYSFLRALFTTAVCFFASQAQATKDVSSPVVDEGKLKFEMRYGLETDDEQASRDKRFRQVYLFEYGVTKWWATRVNFKLQTLNGDGTDYTATEWDNKFQLFFEKQDGFNGAFKTVYSFANIDGVPDTFEFKTMAERKFGPIKIRGNASLVWDVGPDAVKSADLMTAFQILTPVDDRFSVGVEMFSDFGEIRRMPAFDKQEHQLGPVVTYKINDQASLETGYYFGLSDKASDGLFKLFFKHTL